MNFSYKKFRIKCNHPFGISRSSHDHYDIVYLYLENNGFVGRGEAAPSDRYNESTDSIIRILENGTAYQSDTGMCGDYNSVIGMNKENSLQKFFKDTTFLI